MRMISPVQIAFPIRSTFSGQIQLSIVNLGFLKKGLTTK
jgi:hypothetical protein